MFFVTCRKLPLHADNTNFQIESLKIHSTSTYHRLRYSKIKQELHPTNLQDTRLGQAVIQLHEKKRIELESLADFEWICELQQFNGLALGEYYSDDRGCQLFMNIIAIFLREENKLDLGLYVVVVVLTSLATRRKFLASW